LQLNKLFSDEQLQLAAQAHQKDLQGLELDSRERMALQEVRASVDKLQSQLSVQERIAGLDVDARERVSSMQIAAGEREAASTMAVNIEGSYASMVATIMNNPDIPAASRQEFLDHAARVRDSNYGLLEQMWNVELEWTTPDTGTSPIPGAPGYPGYIPDPSSLIL